MNGVRGPGFGMRAILSLALLFAAAGTNALWAAPPHAALRTGPKVMEISSTTGTGTLNLNGAATTKHQTFVAGVGDDSVVPYMIEHTTAGEWEMGIGTVNDATPDTLARTTVLRGTNGTSAVNFSSGDKRVYVITLPDVSAHVAAAAPTVNDDNNGSNGTFVPGSFWIDTVTGITYVLIDDTNGAAVWRKLTNNLNAESELTLSSNAVTITSDRHTIDTEGDAAQDFLDTLNGGVQGSRVFLRQENGSRDIDIRDEAGNIKLSGSVGTGLRLSTDHYTEFAYNSTNSTWYHVGGGFLIGPQPNVLLNGSFRHWYRQTTSATATADDAYYAPKWYNLIQNTGSTVAQTSGLSRNGATTACKLVAGGTTNRFGVAQIVEAKDTHPLRGHVATFQASIRSNLNAGSGDMDVRLALLEWTGTADTVTSETVADWTSGTFTTSGFFASTTLTVLATDKFDAVHNTWQVGSLTASVSSSANNLIVMVWTEDVPANAADFLEVTEAGLYRGWSQEEWHDTPGERALCERFLWRAEPSSIGLLVYSGAVKATSTVLVGELQFPTMRAAPTFSHTIASYNNAGAAAATQMDAVNHVTGAIVQITGALTLSAGATSRTNAQLFATAGTSWNGTVGNALRLRFGVDTTDYLLLSAEL